MAVKLTDENFDNEVIKSSIPVLVDFWAEWCGPCKMIMPIIDELAKEFSNKVKFGKLDVDDSPNTAAKFGIRSIPTIMIFKDGKVMDQMIGVQPKNVMKAKIESSIS